MTSTTVSGNGDGISNSFAWRSLASILNIAPGNYVVGAFGTWSGDDKLAYDFDGNYTIQPGMTFAEDRYLFDSSGLLYPLGNDGTDPGIFGANFSEAEAEAVPGPLPLVGAAAAFGMSRPVSGSAFATRPERAQAVIPVLRSAVVRGPSSWSVPPLSAEGPQDPATEPNIPFRDRWPVRRSFSQPGTGEHGPAKAVSPKACCSRASRLKNQALTETPPAGFEPATGCLEGSCSIQLS